MMNQFKAMLGIKITPKLLKAKTDDMHVTIIIAVRQWFYKVHLLFIIVKDKEINSSFFSPQAQP
jgi:hypothetical protein